MKVCDETWDRDNFPIFIDAGVDKFKYVKKTFRLSSKRTNWKEFYSILEDSYDDFLSTEYDTLLPEENHDFFTQKVTEAMTISTPRKKLSFNQNHRPKKNYKIRFQRQIKKAPQSGIQEMGFFS